MLTALRWSTKPLAATNGPVVKISDEYQSFYAPLPSGLTLKDACIEFTCTYDFDGHMSNIYCKAAMYDKDGVRESLKFDFRDGSSHIEFA